MPLREMRMNCASDVLKYIFILHTYAHACYKEDVLDDSVPGVILFTCTCYILLTYLKVFPQTPKTCEGDAKSGEFTNGGRNPRHGLMVPWAEASARFTQQPKLPSKSSTNTLSPPSLHNPCQSLLLCIILISFCCQEKKITYSPLSRYPIYTTKLHAFP